MIDCNLDSEPSGDDKGTATDTGREIVRWNDKSDKLTEPALLEQQVGERRREGRVDAGTKSEKQQEEVMRRRYGALVCVWACKAL